MHGPNPHWVKPAVWITFLAVMALIAVILHWGLYAYGVWVGIALVLVSLFIGGIDRRDQRRSGERHKLLEPTVWMGLLGLTLIVAFVAFTEMGGISSGRIFFSGVAAVWILSCCCQSCENAVAAPTRDPIARCSGLSSSTAETANGRTLKI